jgi:asparaginyl-tRNA synthetase
MEQTIEIDRALKLTLVARIESALYRGAEQYFIKNGFVNIPSVPHIVDITGACENVNTLYDLDYHGKEALLTQTGQTALEILLSNGLDKVCCTIHSFRKEQQADNRHLTEFPLIELEFVYKEGDGFEQLLEHIEGTIKSMIRNTIETEKETLNQLDADIDRLYTILNKNFTRIEYSEAIAYVGKNWGQDLNHEDEQKIVSKHGNIPIFVMRYPEKIKFFNMQRNKQIQGTVNSTDLLLPYSGESAGAAVREHDYELLVEKLLKSDMYRILSTKGKTLEDFSTYLNAVKENPVPHAGCGIGLPRVTQFILREQDIKQATVYPMNKHSL